ncbi:hypothetical protein Ahy_B08g091018 [Arachis hypogaea]|uniref:Transposase MuDR plant domain-containing protein n=1 Tax=Arachis hypogaea TaxID=3818 RepID=A0A444Y1D0_ARAHY|nr:hypothetical protein Ahy_B08g091018 [Arachis hypogaea]
MRNSNNGVIFECESPSLLRTRRANSLSKLKSMILTHVSSGERKKVGKVGYRMLAPMGNGVFRFRLFCLDGDEHVRLMFDVHRRIMGKQVMELSAEARDVGSGASGSSNFVQDDHPLAPQPLHSTSPVVDMDVEDEKSDKEYVFDSHESGSSDDDDEDEFIPETPVGNSIFEYEDVNYNTDDGVEFRVGHRFRSRETVLQGMENYIVRRSTEYRVVKSDRLKYHVHFRQLTDGCPWSLCVAFRLNLGY